MKLARFLPFLLCFIPCLSFGATSSEFQDAAKLLSAARRGDIQSVQILINSGANVNYVDSTGLSLVCTAVMNNDKRAIQILQMYGADASNCERQIKDYKRKSTRAANGEEYGFFSGLSSSHVLLLSAIGAAAVIGGVTLLSDAFDSSHSNNNGSSGGSHGGGGGGGSGGSGTVWFTVPYGPAYLTDTGAVNQNFDITGNLPTWDVGSHSAYFDYLKNPVELNANTKLQNYLLMMGGYYALASGYMGQLIFRDLSSHAPVLSENGYQKRPVRVALVTGRGVNPTGSAGYGDGIIYASSTSVGAATTRVDKYANNNLNSTTGARVEDISFDLSGSGTVFNTFANVNDSALAKIVAGWEAGGNPISDLYGFVPQGQLAIYRTGDGYSWNVIDNATSGAVIGEFIDGGSEPDGKLSEGDSIVMGGFTYNVVTALSQTTIANPTITIGDVVYGLTADSQMFIAKCAGTETECSNFAIYVGQDGEWYIKNASDANNVNDIDDVYIVSGGDIFTYKTKEAAPYKNFTAMLMSVGNADVVANTDFVSATRDNNYTTIGTFVKDATQSSASDLTTFYKNKINSVYNNSVTGANQGQIAASLFGQYSVNGASKAMIVMPAGEYVAQAAGQSPYLTTPDATFENYAPLLYDGLEHNFMTVVAVSHTEGTADVDNIIDYGNGINSQYGPLTLSTWTDSAGNEYQSRRCGLAGVGSGDIDPWCFAAAGPTAEMATASAAGAVASLKSAFDYMDNNQIFALLALTADGPYLATYTEPTTSTVTAFTTDTLAQYLKDMYEIPLEYDISSLTSAEYLELFKQIYGYGMINLERAIRPGRSVSYYSDGKIVSSSGNAYWRSGATHASSVLSLTGHGAIKTSFYDVLQSADGGLSVPRVWTDTVAMNSGISQHGLYMGDILGDFDVDSHNKRQQKIGDFEFSMSVSSRAYDDNMNGLDNLRVAFVGNDFALGTEYQNHLTDGQSRFDGRANSLLSLASNALSVDVEYKVSGFAFGVRAFNGAITDESLLETDPVVSSQYEPGRLGLVNGGAFNTKYSNDKFAFDMSFGIMNENNTVLGMYSDGLLSMRGAKTNYVDMFAVYTPFENVKLSLRGTLAKTKVDEFGGVIADVSDITSNAFALGLDVGGFGLTVAAPLSVVDGNMGYSYAEFDVVENAGRYEVALNNPHIEYVDLVPQNREFRFTTSYKRALGAMTDGGVEFMYRVHPNNVDTFGNESILMLKIHHRVGI